jgi:hypothetical protein
VVGGLEWLGVVGGSGESVGESVGGGSGDSVAAGGSPNDGELAVGVAGTDGGNWLSAIRVPLSQALNTTTASTAAGTHRLRIELTLGA